VSSTELSNPNVSDSASALERLDSNCWCNMLILASAKESARCARV
jgi:hypothetical protein